MSRVTETVDDSFFVMEFRYVFNPRGRLSLYTPYTPSQSEF